MGMYTGLRIKVYVKEEYRSMIQAINEYEDWRTFVNQFPFLYDYAYLGRAEFIPRGALAYMPSSWEDEHENATDGFQRNIDMGNGYWTFQCSINNAGEIEVFFDEVLPHIISHSDHIEYLYEEWDRSDFYEFKDGKIQLIPTNPSKYKNDDDERWKWYGSSN
ncbi:hypothetical protein KLEB273_gp171 [Bacillus phage vB_BauM_KLEB27-3]|nr:hypothetical protein KLEB273_gp171 [Bacillus phage vB_BauM_KLEB27-3]